MILSVFGGGAVALFPLCGNAAAWCITACNHGFSRCSIAPQGFFQMHRFLGWKHKTSQFCCEARTFRYLGQYFRTNIFSCWMYIIYIYIPEIYFKKWESYVISHIWLISHLSRKTHTKKKQHQKGSVEILIDRHMDSLPNLSYLWELLARSYHHRIL